MQLIAPFNIYPQDRIQDMTFVNRLHYMTRWFCGLKDNLNTEKMKKNGASLVPKINFQKRLASIFASTAWDWDIWTNTDGQRSFIYCLACKLIFFLWLYTTLSIFQFTFWQKLILLLLENILILESICATTSHTQSHWGEAVQ